MDLSTKNNHKIIFPSRTTSNSFAINTIPRGRAIQRTKQLLPVRYLFQPVDPPPSSYNNHGICVKVIEYVLETKKKRLTDQTSENTQGASSSEYTPVNYNTVTTNNQAYITSLPNIHNTVKPKSSIVVTRKGANKKRIASVPLRKLKPRNQIRFDKSLKIFNFSKTSGPVKSTSNNNQNGFPQISYSTSNQYLSSFAKSTPTQLDTQLLPNPSHFENQEEIINVYHPNYDVQMLPSIKSTNEVKNLLWYNPALNCVSN